MTKNIRFKLKKQLDEVQEAIDDFVDVDENGDEILCETFAYHTEDVTGYYAEKLIEEAKNFSESELEILKNGINKLGKTEEDFLYEEVEKMRDYKNISFKNKDWFETLHSLFEYILVVLCAPIIIPVYLIMLSVHICNDMFQEQKYQRKVSQLKRINQKKYRWHK